MAELRKVHEVLSRQTEAGNQKVLLTLDALIGQNGLAQARAFTEAVKCDGVFLAKMDGTARGGIVLTIADELKLPILFIGTGEQPDDIAPFQPREFVDALFASNDPG
jgi:fused signal recognition particle receptor